MCDMVASSTRLDRVVCAGAVTRRATIALGEPLTFQALAQWATGRQVVDAVTVQPQIGLRRTCVP